ncbi:hypothetical protein F4815DRAFT_249356 [Daldinia loculata]|nr:hypothetical protein F4815DRAFT_249356 [Daldinia loculata]
MADVNNAWENTNFMFLLSEDYSGITSACDKLGDLLGICDETCEEVKEKVLANFTPITIPPLCVTIGFPSQGIAHYLGSKPGGQRFLALVCTLVTAFNLSECAQVLVNLMGRHLKFGEIRCPTAEQLNPLLNTVEARCNLSNFASHVVDYEIILSHELRKRYHGAAFLGRLAKTPDANTVAKLAELLILHQAGGPNDGKPKAITIQAGRCVPWIVAFLRWWLRKEPMVYIGEGQSPQYEKLIQGETNIGIKLVLPTQKDAPEPIRIRAIYSESHWEDWNFHQGHAEHYNGLVPMRTYFRLMLNALKLDQGQANEAAVEVIPYALSTARKGLTMCSEGCVPRSRWGSPCDTTTDIAGAKSKLWQKSQEEDKEGILASEVLKISSGRFEPFPERADINSILQLVGGCEGKHMQDLRSRQMGLPLWGHKEAAAFLEQARHEDERKDWLAGFRSQFPLGQPGPTTIFVEQIAHIVATILVLSLFRNSEGLMVRPDPFIWQNAEFAPSTAISAICRISRAQTACCDVTEWHRVCRKLAGEPEGRSEIERRNAIISCGAGQVVWPAVTLDWKLPVNDESYLRLHWCRGKIFNHHGYRLYRSIVAMNSRVTPVLASRSAPVIPPRLTPSNASGVKQTQYGFNLQLHPLDNQVLECCLLRSFESEGNRITFAALDPTGVLKTLASAERIESCPHDEHASVNVVTTTNALGGDGNAAAIFPDVYLCTPEDALPWLRDWARRADVQQVARQGLSEILAHVRGAEGPPGAVAVIPTAADDRLRIFTLAKPVGAHVAIRGHACLACCVKFCKQFGFNVLVL